MLATIATARNAIAVRTKMSTHVVHAGPPIARHRHSDAPPPARDAESTDRQEHQWRTA
jgi:hypothetical protein